MIRTLPVLLGFLFLSVNAKAQFSDNALNFDGTDDYVDCPLPIIFTTMSVNSFTIELWVNPTIGSFERLFFAQSDVDNFASISLNPSGEIVFYLNNNGINHSVQSADVMNSLEWAHVAVTWDANSLEAKIFLNGNEVSYATGVFVSSTGVDSKMTFGSRTDGAQSFTGELDELTIWSVAKQECEISFDMNAKKIGTEPNCVSAYTFGYGTPGGANPSETSLNDLAFPNENGTLMNFALNGPTSNWVESLASVIRMWGADSEAFLGQLGLVSTISADTYQWIYCMDGTPVPGATNVTFDPPTEDPAYDGTNDWYAVISTEGNCVDTSACYIFNGNVSVDEADDLTQLSIYPNPSNGKFNVDLPDGSEEIQIVSLTGEMVYQTSIIGMNEVTINLPELNGFYFVRVKTQSGIIASKIIIENN